MCVCDTLLTLRGVCLSITKKNASFCDLLGGGVLFFQEEGIGIVRG